MNRPRYLGGLLGAWLAVQSAGAAEPVSPENPPAAAPEAQPVFDILEYQVDGNTVLDVQTIEKTVYPFLGPGKGIDEVEKARSALETVYRDKGYPTVLVEIPEQDVEGGLVRLKVVEGSIERLKITGSRYYALGKIREGVPALAEGQVPYMPAVQEQMAKLSQASADRNLTPIFRAGATPGKMEAEIRVKDELPLHGSLEMNGRNTEHTSRSRLIASLRYDNLWQAFHSASLQYQVSPENYDEVEVWSGTYVLPTGWSDTRLALYGVGIQSNTNLGTTVGGSNVVGSGLIFGARLVKPFGSIDNYFHSATFGFDYKDFDQVVGQTAGSDTGHTPIQYVPFTVGYDGTLRRERSLSSASLAAHFSIRGLGNDAQQFEDKRFHAQPDYLYLSADLRHQHELPYDLRVLLRASGQLTDQPLISNEQFALGGPTSVRGYYQTQQLGDDGLNLSVELHSPKLTPPDWEFSQNLRALTFFDWGYLWIKDALPKNPSHYQLASTGLGLRMQILRHWTGELDWGHALYAQGSLPAGHNRIDFRLAYEF